MDGEDFLVEEQVFHDRGHVPEVRGHEQGGGSHHPASAKRSTFQPGIGICAVSRVRPGLFSTAHHIVSSVRYSSSVCPGQWVRGWGAGR